MTEIMHAQHAVPLQLLYRHRNLFHYFPAVTQAIEVLLVLEGAKPVTQQLILEEDLPKIEGFCKNLHLGITNYAAGEGWQLVMIAENQHMADNALLYANMKNHDRLGSALGYPPCCVANYQKHIHKVSSEEEYALLTDQTGRIPFPMNYLLRSLDASLLSHVPCSFTCKKSMVQANRTYEIVKKYNPNLADYLEESLRGPVVVHQHAAHPLRGYRIVDQDVFYNQAGITKESIMNDVFSKCNKVEVLGHNHLRLCQGNHKVDEIKGKHVRFLMFD